MGTKGGRAPAPYAQRVAATRFMRVPWEDWPRLKIGAKTEFRSLPRKGLRLALANKPTPVVAYAINPTTQQHDCKVMVVESWREEPVFLISDDPAALAREGFPDYAHFRRYWRKRREGRYMPMEMVYVWRIRPLTFNDLTELGRMVLLYLYGEFLDQLPDELPDELPLSSGDDQ